jgi:hypothetical protein
MNRIPEQYFGGIVFFQTIHCQQETSGSLMPEPAREPGELIAV